MEKECLFLSVYMDAVAEILCVIVCSEQSNSCSSDAVQGLFSDRSGHPIHPFLASFYDFIRGVSKSVYQGTLESLLLCGQSLTEYVFH